MQSEKLVELREALGRSSFEGLASGDEVSQRLSETALRLGANYYDARVLALGEYTSGTRMVQLRLPNMAYGVEWPEWA